MLYYTMISKDNEDLYYFLNVKVIKNFTEGSDYTLLLLHLILDEKIKGSYPIFPHFLKKRTLIVDQIL